MNCILPILLLFSTVLTVCRGGGERPNILFILADDLGIGDLQCYGNPFVDTPAINSLAREGVLFTNHYAPSPLCAPSRAGFLTGRFNHRTGAVDVPSNRGLDRIALGEKTFGEHFREAGYGTALIGKWHNGLYCRDYLPHARGFDLFFGFPNGGQDYWKWNLLRNDAQVPHDGRYLTDALNEEAIEFIRKTRRKGDKFALFLTHHAPHSPFQAPEGLVEKYRKRVGANGSETVAVIYAMIEAMDRGLGRVFDVLREEGIREETLIVFSSDNGAYLGGKGAGSTRRFHASYSGNKGDVGEQGIRVPAIVSWPGVIPEGRTVNEPVHGCDWLPTLLSICREQEIAKDGDDFDGLNIFPLLLGQKQQELEDRWLPFQKNRYRPVGHSDAAIRRGRWKLVWPGVPVTMGKDSARDNPSYLRGIIHPHWEMPLDRGLDDFPSFPEMKPRLFDLFADPAERNNLAAEKPALVGELVALYDSWFEEVMRDWEKSRESILEHDRLYWRGRTPPDAGKLFEDFWLWSKAGSGIDPKSADPLEVFRGYWREN